MRVNMRHRPPHDDLPGELVPVMGLAKALHTRLSVVLSPPEAERPADWREQERDLRTRLSRVEGLLRELEIVYGVSPDRT